MAFDSAPWSGERLSPAQGSDAAGLLCPRDGGVSAEISQGHFLRRKVAGYRAVQRYDTLECGASLVSGPGG